MSEHKSPEDDLHLIGKLAVVFQLTGEEEIWKALVVQEELKERGIHRLLGEILVERGIIAQDQLDLILLVQDFLKMRSMENRLARVVPISNGSEHGEGECSLLDRFRLFEESKTIHSLAHLLMDKSAVTQEQREQLGQSLFEALLHRFVFEKLMGALLTDFASGRDTIDLNMERALRTIGEFSDADRAYVQLLSTDAKHMTITYEWSSPRVQSKERHWRQVGVEDIPSWMEKLKRSERVLIPYVNDSDGGAPGERLYLAMGKTRSLALEPLAWTGSFMGCVGLESVRVVRNWSRDTLAILKVAAGVFAAALGRRQAREALRASEARFRRAYEELNSIYRNSLAGLRVVDTQFNVIQINESLAKMISMTREQAMGAKCYEILPGPHCHTDRCTLARIMRGEIIKGEEVMKRCGKTDRKIIALFSAAPFYDQEGAMVGMVQDLHDVTEQKGLESIAEAVESMNNIGYVFTGIRHEIGNPINSMKMTLNVLKSNIDSFPQDKVIKYIDRAVDQISKMESLLKSLKSFSMFEKPFIQEINLAPFLNDLIRLVEDDFAVRNIRINATTSPGAEVVRVDSRALQQVLLNVLTNASDALAGRPLPRIALTTCRVSGLVCLMVQDNGCGISPVELRNLFKPFCTSKPHGTGLGLVIAKKMLAAMECGIGIQSSEGLGTTVTVYIPAGRSHEKRAALKGSDHR